MAEKEYIEREAAYKACEAYFSGVCVYDVSASEVINDFEEVIDAVPTADVAPVKHGRWVETTHKGYKCNLCNCLSSLFDENLKSEFCPWCGAKMDGGEQK